MNKPKRGYFDARTPAVTPPTPTINSLKPHDCFVYPRCGAQVCPFDPDWKRRKHYTGETVCTILKESTRPTADVFFSAYFAEGEKLLAEIKSVIPVMIRQHPILRRELDKAADTPSRFDLTAEGVADAD